MENNTKGRFIQERYIALLLVLVLSVFGCQTGKSTTVASAIQNTQLRPTKALPLSTPTPILPTNTQALPTWTISPSPTPNPTFTPQPSPSSTPAATDTPLPTLTKDQQKSSIKELLKPNGDCILPCFWGIFSGSTSLTQIVHLFGSLGKQVFANPYRQDVDAYEAGFQFLQNDEYAELMFGITTNNDIVDTLYVFSVDYNDPDEFKAMWQEYSPERVIQVNGPPKSIWLHSTRLIRENPEMKQLYELWIVYDDFILRYTGKIPYTSVYRVCPTFLPSGNLFSVIYLYLKSSSSKANLSEDSELNFFQPESMPVEKATSLTYQDVLTVFAQENQPICFNTPRDIWR